MQGLIFLETPCYIYSYIYCLRMCRILFNYKPFNKRYLGVLQGRRVLWFLGWILSDLAHSWIFLIAMLANSAVKIVEIKLYNALS